MSEWVSEGWRKGRREVGKAEGRGLKERKRRKTEREEEGRREGGRVMEGDLEGVLCTLEAFVMLGLAVFDLLWSSVGFLTCVDWYTLCSC